MATILAPCLMFAPDGVETLKMTTALLRKRGLSVTTRATEQACLELLEKQPWYLLVIDATGVTDSPLHLLSRCSKAYPDIATLVLVPSGDITTTVRAMKAGATDCIEKPTQRYSSLGTAALFGKTAAGSPPDRRRTLTMTERLVLRHIMAGQTSSEIARSLCRSPRTIEVHRSNIMKKMSSDSLADLVRQMIGKGDNPS